MKHLIYNLALIVCILIAEPAQSQSFEKSRTYHKTYPLTDQMEVSIQNKYGDIQIINWEKDSVKMEVFIKVISNKEAKVDKLFSSIQVNFRANHFYVVAQTELLGKNSFWTEISDKTKNIFNATTTTKIDYVVYIPNSTKLNLTNKYGNVYMGDYIGDLNIDLSNGDFKAHFLSGKTMIKMSFGDMFVEKIDRATIESNYVEAQIEECIYLDAITRTSKMYINLIQELQLDSGHDKYYIGSIQKIRGISKFSFVKLDLLKSNLTLNQKFGALHLKGLSNELENFHLEAYKTDLHLSLSYENSYLIDFTSIKLPVIQYPTGEFEKTEEVIDAEKGLLSTKVLWGDKKNKHIFPLHILAEEGNVFINVK